ncbi:MAG: hypothetical protein AWU55_3012 [Halomonadaceae bacterium T82-2]|nr:MAG: hypothetical protein AWU55_3012 [Halomonadaceae bacterium T82-2]
MIFRRYRRTKNGKVLDAREYGYEAWPITPRRRMKKKPKK